MNKARPVVLCLWIYLYYNLPLWKRWFIGFRGTESSDIIYVYSAIICADTRNLPV